MNKNPEIQFRSPEEIKAYQESRLAEELLYLQNHSRFYQRLFQAYIIRKTKCFDFWERNVLFPKTKRSFFRTPTPSTLPFSA